MTTRRALSTLFLLAAVWPAARAQEDSSSGSGSAAIDKVDSSDPTNKTWTSAKKVYYGDDVYKVVLKNGTVLEASGPFKVKDGRTLFHILINHREGPLTSVPVDEVDLAMTERLNQPRPQPPAERPQPTYSSLPVFDTREMGALAESAEMRVERERIKRLRDTQSEKEYQDYLAAKKVEGGKPSGGDDARNSSAVSPQHLMLAKERKVQKGMNGLAVVLSWGDPDKKEPVPENTAQERWTYLVKGREPYFLTFEADQVVQIQNGERLLYTASLDDVVPPKEEGK